MGLGNRFVGSDCVFPSVLLCVSNWFKWLVNNILPLCVSSFMAKFMEGNHRFILHVLGVGDWGGGGGSFLPIYVHVTCTCNLWNIHIWFKFTCLHGYEIYRKIKDCSSISSKILTLITVDRTILLLKIS